jgi:ataxin-10
MGRSLKSFRRDGLLKLVSPQINPYGTQATQTQLFPLYGKVKNILSRIVLFHTSVNAVHDRLGVAEADTREVRRMALAALQFLANLTAGNAETSERLFKDARQGAIMDWLESFGQDRMLVTCTCVVVHNYLACASQKQAAVKDFLEEAALVTKLLRLVLPPSIPSYSSSSVSSSCRAMGISAPRHHDRHRGPPGQAEGEEEDPVFEWIYLILLKVLEAQEGLRAFDKSGLDRHALYKGMSTSLPSVSAKAPGPRGAPPPIFTAEQLVLLHLAEHTLTDRFLDTQGQQRDDAPLLLRDGGVWVLELVHRVKEYLQARRFSARPSTPSSAKASKGKEGQYEQARQPEWLLLDEAVATVMRLIGTLLAREERQEGGREEGKEDGRELRDLLLEHDVISLILQLLQGEGGKANGEIPPMDRARSHGGPASTARMDAEVPDGSQPSPSLPTPEGRKTRLIQVLGNLCHGHGRAQEMVREQQGLPLVLNHCNVDSENPFLREWAVVCVRFLCDDPENRRVIASLQGQEVVQSPVMQEMGVDARLVAAEQGRLRLHVKRRSVEGGKRAGPGGPPQF